MVDGKWLDCCKETQEHSVTSTTPQRQRLMIFTILQMVLKLLKIITCKVAWVKLSSGEIGYHSKEHQGQYHEPIIKRGLFCFSVLHFKLHSVDFLQTFLYHLVAGVLNPDYQRFIAPSKQECINKIRA